MSVNFHKIMSDKFKVQDNLITICIETTTVSIIELRKAEPKHFKKNFFKFKLSKLGHNRQQNHIFY